MEQFTKSDSISLNENILREGIMLIEELGLQSPAASDYIMDLAKRTTGDKGFLLNYAKRLVGDGDTKLAAISLCGRAEVRCCPISFWLKGALTKKPLTSTA